MQPGVRRTEVYGAYAHEAGDHWDKVVPLEDGARRRSLRVMPRTAKQWEYWWKGYECNDIGPMRCSAELCLCRARKNWVQLWQTSRSWCLSDAEARAAHTVPHDRMYMKDTRI